MNANTVTTPGSTDAIISTSIPGLYRALAIAEAERAEGREQALLDGLGTDEDEGDWDIYLHGAAFDVQ